MGYEIKIEQDPDPMGPREWDNVGTMACFHNRYSLGDQRHGLSKDEVRDILQSKDFFSYRLYLYDHSGIGMSIHPFSCPWDSGMVGAIFVSKERVRNEWNVKRISKKLGTQIMAILSEEVKEYDAFLRGDVYGFEILKDGETVDSCWGFYSEEDCRKEAEAFVGWHKRATIKNHCQMVKTWIRHKVPLDKRIPLEV